MNEDDIFPKVQKAIAASMAMSVDRIKRDSRLVVDLGVDSLDFLDLLFQLEKIFGIELQGSDIYGSLMGNPGAGEEAGVFLSDAEVAALSVWMPALALRPAGEKLRRKEAFSYVSVESLILVVKKKMGEIN